MTPPGRFGPQSIPLGRLVPVADFPVRSRRHFSSFLSGGYLGAYLRRLRSRLGAPKAITATAHKLARILYNRMRCGVAYARREESAYAEEVRERLERFFHRRRRSWATT